MRKQDNDWSIEVDQYDRPECIYDAAEGSGKIEINTVKYTVSEDVLCLTHAILLLVDAVNDKSI